MSCEITYEDLAAFAVGELEPERQAEITRHVSDCTACSSRLTSLTNTDALLRSIKPTQPAISTILATRRTLSTVIGRPQAQEIMTLEETANFLRLTNEQLGEVMEELPAFELAGQIRVRRTRLIEWIQRREQDYSRQVSESWVARAGVHGIGLGVA